MKRLDKTVAVVEMNRIAEGVTGNTTAKVTSQHKLIYDALIKEHGEEKARLYDSTRTSPLTKKSLYKEGVSEAGHFVKGRLKGVGRSVADVAPGEGKVVGRPGEQTAVYRDPRDKVHTVSARCTRLGCIVSWNPAESSWDCPCHGSRFSVDGEVIHGPAVRNLEKKDPSCRKFIGAYR